MLQVSAKNLEISAAKMNANHQLQYLPFADLMHNSKDKDIYEAFICP
jgi:hypothetical protein